MVIEDKDALIKSVSDLLGNSDEALTVIENLSDTIDSLNKDSEIIWKQKYDDLDNEWRNKYKERFFTHDNNAEDNQNEANIQEDNNELLTFEKLFKEE